MTGDRAFSTAPDIVLPPLSNSISFSWLGGLFERLFMGVARTSWSGRDTKNTSTKFPSLCRAWKSNYTEGRFSVFVSHTPSFALLLSLHTLTHTHSLSHTHTLIHTHAYPLSCAHTHTLTQSQTFTFSLAHILCTSVHFLQHTHTCSRWPELTRAHTHTHKRSC